MADKATAARELLELEKQYFKAGTLDPARAKRWNSLLGLLFGKKYATDNRRSMRLQASVGATVQIGPRRATCSVIEVSRRGASLTGPECATTHEDTLRLVAIDVDGKADPLDLMCNVVRKATAGGAPLLGVEFAPTNPAAAMTDYFNRVYYPIYVRHLERIAAG